MTLHQILGLIAISMCSVGLIVIASIQFIGMSKRFKMYEDFLKRKRNE